MTMKENLNETIYFEISISRIDKTKRGYLFNRISENKKILDNLLYTYDLEELVSFVVKYIIRYNISDHCIDGPENILYRICNELKNQKYTAKLKINDRIIEIEGLKGLFKCEFMGCDFVSENNEIRPLQQETEQDYCCDECLLQSQTSIDDQEITKDLMLDEVISSQHLEIERLTTIIQDLVTTNLKLVEILASKK